MIWRTFLASFVLQENLFFNEIYMHARIPFDEDAIHFRPLQVEDHGRRRGDVWPLKYSTPPRDTRHTLIVLWFLDQRSGSVSHRVRRALLFPIRHRRRAGGALIVRRAPPPLVVARRVRRALCGRALGERGGLERADRHTGRQRDAQPLGGGGGGCGRHGGRGR